MTLVAQISALLRDQRHDKHHRQLAAETEVGDFLASIEHLDQRDGVNAVLGRVGRKLTDQAYAAYGPGDGSPPKERTASSTREAGTSRGASSTRKVSSTGGGSGSVCICIERLTSSDEPELLTVEEAVVRLGLTREEILAEFEKNKIPFEVTIPPTSRRARGQMSAKRAPKP